jgi:hypothetical protein
MAGNSLPHPDRLVASRCSTANLDKWLRTSPTVSNCFSAREELISTELANEDKKQGQIVFEHPKNDRKANALQHEEQYYFVPHNKRRNIHKRKKRINEETDAYMYFISL